MQTNGNNCPPFSGNGNGDLIVIDDEDSSIEIIESPDHFSEPSVAYGSPEN